MNSQKVHIIGAGFAAISAACYLAQSGFEVHVYEKNGHLGGRARQWQHEGFSFDMGPTWYWMPDVFEKFFEDFGKKPSDYYELERLDPAYRVYFGSDDFIDIEADVNKIKDRFEAVEKGAGDQLDAFLKKAKKNYDIAISNLVYKPGLSPFELVRKDTVTELGQFASTIKDQVAKRIKNEKLRRILEFPVLFLGAKPSQTPAFYSFMNHADFGLGTWYPKGGMISVVNAMVSLAESLGVQFYTHASVSSIQVNASGTASSIRVNNVDVPVDILLSGADYHHTEQLLPDHNRSYSPTYWDKRVMAPSSLLFYVGFNRKIPKVLHHTLFFDTSFEAHASAIYDRPAWPEEPLFYASFPSINDPSVAPEGKEAAVFLIPLAAGLEDSDELRERYFDIIMDRLEYLTGERLRWDVSFKKSYCVQDFVDDYNSFKGNAYGMANTLFQTAYFRPKIKSKKIQNMFFTGQLTVPGPGVPPSLISGKIAAEQIVKSRKHETFI